VGDFDAAALGPFVK